LPSADAVEDYRLACPDVIAVTCLAFPNIAGQYPIEPDGTVAVPGLGAVVVGGCTAGEAADRLAAAAGLPAGRIRVTIHEHNSRVVFLSGPGAGSERIVPYRGPETVVEFLQRCGGLEAQAEVSEIHVVRPNVATGRRPDVFTVDLAAILVRGDAASNVTLEPYDQVYVAATRRSAWARYLPTGSWPSFNRR
jgi:protein involved in polysaccharide export with SLBB domain